MELQLNDMSDETLVAASREGDRSAYATLVRRHSKRVYAVCMGILGSVTDSEDIFQETFVKGMANIQSLRDDGQFVGWISQIARNLCRDHLFFNNLNSPAVNTNIHYATRISNLLFEYQGEVAGVNTDSLEGVPSMDADGNIYFISTRSYFSNLSTIYRGIFTDGAVSEVVLVEEIHSTVIGDLIFDVEINPEGNTLYSVDGVYSGNSWPDSADFFIAVKNDGLFERLENSDEIFQNINTTDPEYAACISADGLEFFLTRLVIDGLQFSTYRAARNSVDEPFGIPKRIEAIDGFAEAPTLSPDENSLYYHKLVDDLFVIFRVTR